MRKKTAIRRKRFKTLPHLLLIQAPRKLLSRGFFYLETRARFLHTPENSRRILGLLYSKLHTQKCLEHSAKSGYKKTLRLYTLHLLL